MVVLLRKPSKDFQERCFDVDSVASSLVAEGARTGVGIPNSPKLVDVRYLDESHDAGLLSSSRTHSGPG